MKPMLYNPYNGMPRDPRDIASDPTGRLMVDWNALVAAVSDKPTPLPIPENSTPIDWVPNTPEGRPRTGWPPGMLQDDSKSLSQWLASRSWFPRRTTRNNED